MMKSKKSAIGLMISKEHSEDFIVFGTGYAGKMVMYILKYNYHKRVLCAFDNDPAKEGNCYWEDIPCKRAENYGKDIPVLICVFDTVVSSTIKKQCQMLGYEKIICITEDDIALETAGWEVRECIEVMYFCKTGEYLNLDAPTKYNEKIQWLKLKDHNRSMSKFTDKYAVKEYVKGTIGEEYVIPTLGIWDSFDEIDFDLLPDRFVLKCTHDSGSVEMVDKKNADVKTLRERITRALSRDFYYNAREPGYIGIPRRIIAEPLLLDGNSQYPKDYKVFVFQGVPRIIQVDYDRFTKHSRIMYSAEWDNLEFSTMYPYDPSKEEKKPEHLKKLLNLATKLARGMKHVRVDFYIVNNRIYFGELTFYHGGGYEKFSDEKWNDKMGSWLIL